VDACEAERAFGWPSSLRRSDADEAMAFARVRPPPVPRASQCTRRSHFENACAALAAHAPAFAPVPHPPPRRRTPHHRAPARA
jgi:hypothetical protein